MSTKEQREEVRTRTGDINNATVRIPLSFPKDTVLEKKLVDFSERGASFTMANDEGRLLAKTPLENISFRHNGKVMKIKNAEVVYAARLKDGSDFSKIGIQFRHDGRKQQEIFPIRTQRYGKEFFGSLDRFASFQDDSGTKYVCEILDVSRYGLAFSLKKERAIFKTSSVINNFRVIINNEVIFDGKVVIARITENKDDFIIGAELRENLLPIENIVKIKESAALEAKITDYADSLLSFERIDAKFRQKVADLQYILAMTKAFLDDEEKRIVDFSPADNEDISRLILEELSAKTYPKINSILEEIDIIGSNIDDNNIHEIYKEYYQAHLHPFIMLGPFPYRVLKKPLGYAGDYEMMNMVYRNAYEGPTLFAKYINKHNCEIGPAQANRNRVAYLTEKIQKAADEVIRKQGRNARIMTIGCGAAIELQRFVELDSNSNNTEVTLIDFDREALAHANEKIMELKVKYGRDIKIHTRLTSIFQIVKDHKKGNDVFDKQDLIYCSGLFEYLTASTCRALIEMFYQYVNKNGQIIIGNFDEANNYRYNMEYGGEWYLIYRNEKLMMDLASKVKDAGSIYVEKEQTGLNDFLVIRK